MYFWIPAGTFAASSAAFPGRYEDRFSSESITLISSSISMSIRLIPNVSLTFALSALLEISQSDGCPMMPRFCP